MKKENGRGFVKRCRWRGPLAFAVTASIIVMALLIFPAGAAFAQTVLTNQVPTDENFSDSGGPYELGMTFSSTSAGNITAIRHWKAVGDNATHVGRIWDAGGNQLAEVTFADNTGSGWKQQALTTPLAIDANTTYVVSVNSGAAGDSGSFYPFGSDLSVTNGDLTGSQGVFIGSPGSFPNTSSQFHYFRDVVVTGGGEPTACIVGEKYVSVTGPGGPFVRNSVTVDGGAIVPPENLNDLPMASFGGTPVFYQFVIKNCGNVDLYNVRLDDCIDLREVGDGGFLVGGANGNCVENPRLIPADPDRIVAPKLTPGESVTVTSADFPNDPISTVDICETFGRDRVEGIVRNDSQVEAEADLDGNGSGETFVFFDDLNLVQCKDQPCIDVKKEVRGVNADGSMTEWYDANKCDDPAIPVPFSDKDAEYRLIVTNCGSETLTNFTVTDEKLGFVGRNFPNTMLAPGASITVGKGTIPEFFKEGVCPDSEFLNTITVSAFGTPSGNEVADSDTACVKCGPCVELVKEVSVDDFPTQSDLKQWFDANACDGSQGTVPSTDSGAEYRLIVKNCGPEDLNNFRLEDNELGINQSFSTFTLPAGDQKIVDAVSVPILAQFLINPSVCPNPEGRFLNTASVFAKGAVSMIEVDDSDPACVTCADCAITIDKKCLVVPPPLGTFDCDKAKPIDSLSMIWDGTANIRIKAWKGSVGSTLLADIDNIVPGQEVTVTGFAGSPNDVIWEIFTAGTDDKIGESTFHVSCSDADMNGPEDCSKLEGDGKDKAGFINEWIFEGMAGNGLALDCTPAELEPLDECTFEAPPPPNCETLGKPTSLTFRYTGLGCSASSNNQGDKSDCSGEPGDEPVSINIVEDPNKITVSPSSGINVGDLVTVSAIGSDMGSEIQLNVGGQFLKIHTSCSAPLAAGDVFGSLELLQFNGLGSGAEVTYSYEVTNIGNFAVDITSVFDDKLGELLETPVTLQPNGGSTTRQKTAFISETTTNEVTATANLPGDGSPCGEAKDQVTVTVTEPTCDVSIVLDTLEDDKIKYKVTNTSQIGATLDTLTVNFPPEYGLVKEVKLDGGIFKKDDSDTYPNGVPSGKTIGPNDWTEADVTKRQLDPGETRTLEVVFTQKSKGEGWVDIVSAGTATFKEFCAVALIKPSGCEIGKPIELIFEYTGLDCSATSTTQDSDKVDCQGVPGDNPVITIKKDPNKITVSPSSGIIVGDPITVSAIGSDMGNEIQLQVGGQFLKFHTSCSQPLAVGDVFGSLSLIEFIPKP